MYSTAYKMLGGKPAEVNTLGQTLKVIREGLPLEMMDKATVILGVSTKEFVPMLGMNIRSFQRNKKNEAWRLTPLQSEQALKITELVAQANNYFGDHEIALKWLNTPSNAFAKKCPIDLLDTSAGIEAVSEKINALAYGMTA
ncbi:hypothetical protein A9Q98_07935 [Thalassotalea sp. 42_200_T64]|nr:hypothetical protein A9Q98_07935 [Thalassotalea sp. 42_200_T64]